MARSGCLAALGLPLVDLALDLLGWPVPDCTSAQLQRDGRVLTGEDARGADFVLAQLDIPEGPTLRLCCSWSGDTDSQSECLIRVTCERGCLEMRNLGGSPSDFETRRLTGGATSQVLASPPDDWAGRAAMFWLDRLSQDNGFDHPCERLVDLASVLDNVEVTGRLGR